MWFTRISFALFVLGLMLALTGAAKVPSPELVWAGHAWPDSLPLFAVGLATCIAGLIGWRAGLRREDAAGALSSLGPKGMMELIVDCRQDAQQLRKQLNTCPGADSELIRERIDSLLTTYFETLCGKPLYPHRTLRHAKTARNCCYSSPWPSDTSTASGPPPPTTAPAKPGRRWPRPSRHYKPSRLARKPNCKHSNFDFCTFLRLKLIFP